MICPDCNHDNIQGVDTCERCGQSLTGLEVTSDMETTLGSSTIAELDPKEPVMVDAGQTIGEALNEMTARRIGCLLATDAGRFVGILTERDVLNKATGDPQGLERTVRDLMTPQPTTCTRMDSIAYALQAMDVGGYRHLPVVDQDQTVGIISVRDILRFLSTKVFDESVDSAGDD